MLLLSDCPDALPDLLPPGNSWQACAAAELADTEQDLWRCLSGTDEVWVGRIDSHQEPDHRAAVEFWSSCVIVEEAPRSQFDVLADRYRQGNATAGPVAALALTGSRFHGHRNRPWVAQRGNLHLSAGLEPMLPVSKLVPALTMLPAVATISAIRRATAGAVQPAIKWVNDILLGDGKIAGVLTTTQIRAHTVQSAVLGVGLNLACAPAVEPTPFVPSVGCLADGLAEPPSLAAMLWQLLSSLADGYQQLCAEGPHGLWQRYREASSVVGQRVRVYDETFGERSLAQQWPEPLARGVVASIEPDLSLRLEGRPQLLSKGRLAMEQACLRLKI